MNEHTINEIDIAISKKSGGQAVEEYIILAEIVEKCNSIFGQFVEVGIGDGTTSQLILNLKNKDKTLFMCDTFEGLVDVGQFDSLPNGFACYSYEWFTKANQYVNDPDVTLVNGYFPDSATEEMNNSKYSFVHIDVDTYESTLKSLEYFSTRMTVGGVIVSHDYINQYTPGVARAIDEFMVGKEGLFTLFTLASYSNSTQAIITRV
jgi:hypothetical protein